MTRRPSAQTTSVLRALASDPERWRYGYELGQEVGLKAGSLYPILMRLHERGLLESSWENGSSAGRPPRHLYRLSGAGVLAAAGLETAQVTARSTASRTASSGGDTRPAGGPAAAHRRAAAGATS